jgi:hypothetical protein
VLEVLRPYLPDIILIGGWVPDLHRRYGALSGWRSKLSFTSELDVLIADGALPCGDRPTLMELLIRGDLRPVGDVTGAAVWTHPDGGDALEFLVPHRGPFRPSTNAVAVTGQPGVKAIMLPDIGFLGRHTVVLSVRDDVPSGHGAAASKNDADALHVRVPRLGAYLINKAVTFPRRVARSGHLFNPKRAKDLLYLRDLLAAGDAVTDAITRDARSICGLDSSAQVLVDGAISNLEFAVSGRFADDIDRAAAMFSEREPAHSPASARADIRGHLVDALELLRPFRSPNQPSDVDE